MTENTKRVSLAAGALVVLLAVGLIIAQAGGDGDDPKGVASLSPSASLADSTPSPSNPKQEVKDAYLRQWDVYARAVRDLDTDGLEGVFTDEALKVVLREVERRRRMGAPSRVRVKHDFAVKIIDASTAVVDDRYLNHSVTIDPVTGKPTERDPNQIVHEVYTMKRVEGVWKVSAIVRQSIRQNKG
ncbi:MAG: hypothetical protein LC808_23570 [Actinobacteria bacterium]|nr:hypothetical protein [Actinomycetota bacterium]